jgi:PST family polysaccharide transporter
MYRKKTLVENMMSLLVMQGATYVLPLLTFPYLVRVLGTGNYGRIAFAQAFVGYFVITTDYGFNLTATRQVAIHRDDPRRLGAIYSAVMSVKLVLLGAGALVFAALVLALPRFRPEAPLFLAAFLMVIGNTLYPVWLFQGLERMRYMTIVNIGSKIIAVGSIFLFVHQRSDYVLAVALQSGGFVVAGIWASLAVWTSFGIPWVRPTGEEIRKMWADGWHVFISQASVSLFGNSNVFILGLFASAPVVGRFAVAEKIVRAVVGLSIPVCNAIYPAVSAMFARSREAAVAFLRRVVLGGGLIFLTVSAGLFLGADLSVRLVTGSPDPNITLLIRLMAILPLTIFVDNIYGTQILLNVGRQREFMGVVLAAGGFSALASIIMVPLFGATGSALVFTATELLVLILMVNAAHGAGVRLHQVGG